jgi:Raf kinase inhibitor-like YbhB/YbcL family protein
MKPLISVGALLALLACAAPQKGGKPEAAGRPAKTDMVLTSTAFADGAMIPHKYAGYGQNVSPDLAWTQTPEGTRAFALICRDPDAPGGTFYHWVMFNISDTVRQLPAGLGRSAVLRLGGAQGLNNFGRVGYDGPKPPAGTHRYYFDLYALDASWMLDQTTTAPQLLDRMQGHVLAKASLMGKYSR